MRVIIQLTVAEGIQLHAARRRCSLAIGRGVPQYPAVRCDRRVVPGLWTLCVAVFFVAVLAPSSCQNRAPGIVVFCVAKHCSSFCEVQRGVLEETISGTIGAGTAAKKRGRDSCIGPTTLETLKPNLSRMGSQGF